MVFEPLPNCIKLCSETGLVSWQSRDKLVERRSEDSYSQYAENPKTDKHDNQCDSAGYAFLFHVREGRRKNDPQKCREQKWDRERCGSLEASKDYYKACDYDQSPSHSSL